MKVNKVKTTILLGVLVSLFVASAIATQPRTSDAVDPFFTLVFKTVVSDPYPDYGNFVKQHLGRIGINVDVVIQDWGAFLDTLLVFWDFDICCIGFSGGGVDPFSLPQSAFTENGSLNCFGYNTDMDYDEDLGTGLNEWYIRQGNLIMPPDSEERVQHCWDWEQYLMDKICPMAPLFSPVGYVATWDNLVGYNYTDGLYQSWGKMSWDGSHPGQLDTSEIVGADLAWSELNPFFYSDGPSGTIIGLCLDNVVWYDADLSVWPHVAESWTFVDDVTVDVTLRDGIKWMDYGGFTNQYVDVDDLYFTIYCWMELSVRSGDWYYITGMEKRDDMTLRIHIDGDDTTPEADPYAQVIPDLSTWLVPEHWLNQTQEADGVTPDITDASWTDYSTNVWGSDLFYITDFTEGVETVLSVKAASNCWLTDPLVDKSNMNFLARFGDYSGGLDTYRQRIIVDQQTRFLEFEAGKLDLVGLGNFQDKKNDYLEDPTKDVQSDLAYFYNWFGFNMRPARVEMGDTTPTDLDPTMTKGLALRKAIAYAIDRVEINDVLHNSENFICDWPIYPKLGIWNNPNIIRYNHDLDKAREYMTRAGYDLGWTPVTPGFTMIITISSLMLVASAAALIIKRRK
jgi:ABC-type transport system substrate-binding protein